MKLRSLFGVITITCSTLSLASLNESCKPNSILYIENFLSEEDFRALAASIPDEAALLDEGYRRIIPLEKNKYPTPYSIFYSQRVLSKISTLTGKSPQASDFP